MVNHPADGLLAAIQRKVGIDDLMTYELGFTDEPGSQIDGQWWCLDKLFPMKARPMTARDSPLAKGHYMGGNVETIYRWADEGINIAKVYLEETKKRGIECFYSYRISDGTSHNEFGRDFAQAHPDWVVKDEWGNAKWNFAVPEARARKLSVLRELAEDYDFDGLEVDFARGPNNLPAGRMWANRRAVSQFLRDFRVRDPEGGAAARPSFPGGGQDPGHSGWLPFRRSGRGDLGSRQLGGHPGPGSAVL